MPPRPRERMNGAFRDGEPQHEDLEFEVTGTVAPLRQFQVLMGDGTYFVVNPNRVD